MKAGLLAAAIRAGRVIDKRLPSITNPLLIMHGSDDQLTDPEGSRRLYARASSADKTIKIYEGLYHEILNEPARDIVLADIASWLDRHLTTQSAAMTSAAPAR
jgi:alpha-beta hydrolase superfamily lysophospholipase